ncbi:MBG domain-containing protein [Pedobacter sp. KLB.chiD]|uniref:MBG domain-containing protein n=1 Tax=Pedobacter sp. KLB.chiD TaxID=3387402 RepID=UPI00399B808A
MRKKLLTLLLSLIVGLNVMAQTPDANGILFVNINKANGIGNSWDSPIKQLADALKAAKSNTAIKQIWVAKGTYKPMYSPQNGDNNFKDSTGLANGADHRNRSFLMVKDVKLYGGFDPDHGIKTLNDKRILPGMAGGNNGTILCGDFNNDDIVSGSGSTLKIQNNRENAYHVIVSGESYTSTELNGFSIKGGNANGTSYIIINNNIAVSDNSGGGIFNASCPLTVRLCNIYENIAADKGGGMFNCFASHSKISISSFYDNSAGNGGGIYISDTSRPVLLNVSITGNIALATDGTGGGLYYDRFSDGQIINSILYGNLTPNNQNDPDKKEINKISSPGYNLKLQITNSIIKDFDASKFEGIESADVFTVDPKFTNPSRGDLTLQRFSPAIGKGNNPAYNALPGNQLIRDIDLAGNPRLLGGNIDIGAYESSVNTTVSSLAGASGSSASTSPFPFTVTFSEAVNGFITSDITVTNGTASNLSTADNTIFNFIVKPSGSAAVSVTVPANVALGEAGNGNTASATYTLTPPNAAPVVITTGGSNTFSGSPVVIDNALTVSDADNTTLNNATVKIIGNFHAGQDILTFSNNNGMLFGYILGSYNSNTGVLTLASIGGNATVAQWQAALRATTFHNLVLSPDTATRTVSFTVNDFNADSNTATKSVTVINEAAVSSIVRSSLSPTNASTVPFQVTFDKPVSGITASNFSLTTTGISGASVSSVSGSGNTYTVVVNTGTGDGTIRLDLANATGLSAGVSNAPYTSGETYTITKSFAAAPTLRIQSAGSASGNGDVTAFVDQLQVLASGTGTLIPNALQNNSFEDNNVTSGNFLKTTQGVVGIPWFFTGEAGISLNNSTLASTAFDGHAVAFLASRGDNNASISQSLALPTGAYQIRFKAIQRNYNSLDQRLNVFVNDVFIGNIQPNNISTYDTFTSAPFNVTAPALTTIVSTPSASPTYNSPISFAVNFSQSVGSTFTASDVTVSGGNVDPTSFSGSGKGPYTFNVTPSGTGTVSVSLAANVASDANNTGNLVSNSVSVQFQSITPPPVVNSFNNGGFINTTYPTFTGTATAGATVMVYVDGMAKGTTTATGGNWSLTMPAALASGSHTVYATAQVRGDVVSANSNTHTFTVDTTAPSVVISSSAGVSGGSTFTSPIQFTVTFSESVSGFTSGGITLGNATISKFSGSGKTYTFDALPKADGVVTVNIAANMAQDAAGNGNTEADQFDITYYAQVPSLIYVDKNVNGGNGSGDSWANAIPELADALVFAKTHEEVSSIYVAKGTYTPLYSAHDADQFADGTHMADPRNRSFVMVKNVKLYGGFDPSNGINTLNDKRILPGAGSGNNGTILSGDFNNDDIVTGSGADLKFQNNGENAYHVLISAGDVGLAELNGFIVQGGNANGSVLIKLNSLEVQSYFGGGMFIISSSPKITHNIFNNHMAKNGGGIYMSSSFPTISQSGFYHNKATDLGGGICVGFISKPSLLNISITGNTAGFGGGLYYNPNAAGTVYNCIIYNNVPEIGGAVNKLIFNSSIIKDYSVNTTGIIPGDPKFTDPAKGDLTLQPGSAAIGKGSNSVYTRITKNKPSDDKDLAGNPRLVGANIDIGAYEYKFDFKAFGDTLLYVNQNINVEKGNGSGDSWANAIPELADALVFAKTNEKVSSIYVAKGTYTPLYSAHDADQFADGTHMADPRDRSFVMVKNVKLYGGFDPSNGINTLNDKRILPGAGSVNNGTILSGDFNNDDIVTGSGADLTFQNNGENAYHVLISAGDVGLAELNGFSINGGNANGYLKVIEVNNIAINCVSGGGMFNSASSPAISQSSFYSNCAGGVGGGMYNHFSSPTITQSRIYSSSASFGGGMYNENSSPIINQSSFYSNMATRGGGMYNVSSSTVISQSSFYGNWAGGPGEVMFNTKSSPKLLNMSMMGNKVGWLYYDDNSGSQIINSILYSNLKSNNISGYKGGLSIINSIVKGLDASTPGIITGNPNFANPGNGDLTLQPGSAAIGQGSNDAYNLATGNKLNTDKDLAGNPRLVGANIDLGAYESSVKDQVITMSGIVSKTYGDAPFGPGANASSGLKVSYASADPNTAEAYQDQNDSDQWKIKIKKAGKVTITASQEGNNNIPAAKSVTFELNIARKTITVTADVQRKTYGDADPTLSYTSAPALVTGDSFTGNLTRTSGENIGSYAIAQGTLTLNDNYDISYTGADLTIGKKAVTVTADAQRKTYGDADPALNYTFAPALVTGDSFTGGLTRLPGENVGTYAINQGTLVLNDNYDISYTGADLTIGKKAVMVMANAQRKTYGDADPALSYTSAPALVTGDSFTGGLTRLPGENVGNYAINQGTLTLNDNYDLSYTGADLTIGRKAITVTADAQHKTYGDVDPALNYTFAPVLVTGDNFTGNLIRTSGENIGSYAIVQGTLTLNDNYELSYTGADLTIGRKAITVTADAQRKTYGDADPALNYTFAPALVTGDSFTGGLTRLPGENVGRYAINQGTLVLNGNYELSYTGADLTIGRKAITVTADAHHKTYGDADPALNYTFAPSLVTGDSFTGNLIRTSGENIGSYAIAQGTLTLNDNYDISYTGADLTIGRKAITVTAGAQSKTYGENDPKLSYTFSPALVNSDSFTGSLTRLPGENVGNYAINQGTLTLNDNYDISYTGADLTIGRKTITVTADAQRKTYGDADPALSYTSAPALVTGDSFTGSLTRLPGENVGTYAINQGTLTLNDNYDLIYTGADLTIGRKAITVTAGAQLKTYGENDPKLSYTFSPALVNSDSFTGGLTRLPGENVGTYSINQGTLTLNDNYDISYTGADLTIGRKTITVTAGAQRKTYGDADPALNYTFAPALVTGDSFTGNLTRTSGENIGSYAIEQGTLALSNDYDLSYTGADLTIGRKAITVTAGAQLKTYGENDPKLSYTFSPALVNSDSFTGVLTRLPGENVGTYAIKQGTLALNGNYSLTYTSADLKIGRKAITVTAGAHHKTYGENDPKLSYTFSPALVVSDSFTGSLTRLPGENVGTYAINQGTLTLNDNYDLSYTGADLTIGRKAITVRADAHHKTYGDTDPALSYTFAPALVTGDSFTGNLIRTSGENIGSYAIAQGTLTLNDNYDISYTGADLTIGRKAITVTADAQRKTYGENDPKLSYTFAPALVTGDSFTGNLTRTSGENIGSYAIEQGTLALSNNYDLSYTGANLTIGRKAITVMADAQRKTYGENDPKLSYTFSPALMNSDSFTGSLTRLPGENVGNYAINQGTLTLNDNYDLSYTGADLTIGRKAITVKADAHRKTYGENDPKLSYTFAPALVTGDSFTGSLTRLPGENVGTYAINQGTLALNGNYSLTYTGADLTIGKKAVTVTADAQRKTYGDADPALSYTFAPTLVTGDSFTGNLTRMSGENIGSYAIEQGTLALSNNYDLSYTGADLTIGRKAITVTANAQRKTYGDVDPALSYTFAPALVTGDKFAGSLKRNVGENVGTYAINQGTLVLNDNYDLSYTGADLTVGKKAIMVTANAQRKTYGDADPALSYTFAPALVTGDSFTGDLTRLSGENVGTYAINQGTLTLSDNYDLSYTGADLTIGKKAVTVTANAQRKTYGDADPALSYTFAPALVTGDSFTGDLTRLSGENVGTYAINQGTLTLSDNYDLSYTGADLTIGKKAVTVTTDAQRKIYGDADPALSYTFAPALVTGDKFAGSLTRNVGENVGTYAINQGTLTLSDNYDLSYIGADLTIGRKAITVTAGAQRKTYGDADPALNYTFSPALVNGDRFSGDLTRVSGEDAGTYTISQGSLSLNANYIINYIGAKLDIAKAILKVRANPEKMCQGDDLPALGISYNGFKSGETEKVLGSKPKVSTTADRNMAGTYPLTPAGGVSGNYDFVYEEGILTIHALPTVNIISDKGTELSKGKTTILTASGGTAYSWSTASGIIGGQNTATLTVRPAQTTTYTVRVINASGCSSIQSITIKVAEDYQLVATNILTPNGDGINDTWMVQNIDMYPQNEVIIIDGNGRKVYQKKGYDNSWNGTFGGNLLAEGTYYYIITYGPDKLVQKGFITILTK